MGAGRILLGREGVEDLLGKLQGQFMSTKRGILSIKVEHPCIRVGKKQMFATRSLVGMASEV